MPKPAEKKESKPDVPEISDFDALKAEFRVDIQNANNRVNELSAMIPQLEREKEQLIGMIAVMRKTLQHGEENGEDGTPDEPEDDGNEQNGVKKPSDGSN